MNEVHLTRFYLSLTARQKAVLQWVCRGLTNAQVAERLCVEPCTVGTHLTAIYEALGLQEGFAHIRPQRFTLITAFAGFFERHPDLCTARAAAPQESGVVEHPSRRYTMDAL